MEDNRIFKYKLVYGLTIFYLFGWILFFIYRLFQVVFTNFKFFDEYKSIAFMYYLFYISVIIFLVLGLIHIFKESRKAFLYINVGLLIIITQALFMITFDLINQIKRFSIPSYFITIFIISTSIFLINYYKHHPKNDEIEQIGNPQ